MQHVKEDIGQHGIRAHTIESFVWNQVVGLVWGKANRSILRPLVCYLLSPPRRELPRGSCLGYPVAAERTLEISQARDGV